MWRARLLRERREGKLSQEKLLEASRRVEATQRKLKKLQDVKKHPGKASRKSPAAMGKKIEAAKQELMHLMLRKKLQERQEALDRVNLDAKCHAENVEELKSRSPNLKEMMRNMDKADQEQLHQATAESQRIQQLFASVDQELRKGRSRRRQNSMQRWCRSFTSARRKSNVPRTRSLKQSSLVWTWRMVKKNYTKWSRRSRNWTRRFLKSNRRHKVLTKLFGKGKRSIKWSWRPRHWENNRRRLWQPYSPAKMRL